MEVFVTMAQKLNVAKNYLQVIPQLNIFGQKNFENFETELLTTELFNI